MQQTGAAAGIAAAPNSALHRDQPIRIKPELTPDPVKPRVALLAADLPDNATASNLDEPAPAGLVCYSCEENHENDDYQL
ncbi:hypothetical protein CN163_12745 [Sinorhizobium meliloti]|nr:hypothetical protein CN163_12745 [Sinorhizobium meliloti]